MRGQDNACGEKHLNRRRRETIEPALDDIAAIPVLLALAAFALRPGSSRQFTVQAGYNGHDGGEEPAPVAVGSAGMHRATVLAAPALYPKPFGDSIEVALDIAVPPKPLAAATRTSPRSRPGIQLALTKEFRQNDRQGKYQVATPGA